MKKIMTVTLLLMCLFVLGTQSVTRPAIISKAIDKIFAEGHWTSWSSRICDAVCGTGLMFRKRLCVPTEEFFGIPTCHGHSIERLAESCETNCPAVDQLRRWYFGPTLPQSIEKSLVDQLLSGNYAFNRKIGGSVQFDCYNALTVEFLVNYTKSVIYWEVNGQRLQYDISRMMLHDYSILGLNDLRMSDSGVYTCSVGLSKKMSRTIMVYSLIVMGEPYQLEVSSASDVSVACHGDVMASLFHGLHVQWIVNTSSHVIKEYRLNAPVKSVPDIIRVKLNYTGMWACVIRDAIHNRTWVSNAFHVKVNPDWMMEVWSSAGLPPTTKFGIVLGTVFLMFALLLACVSLYVGCRKCFKKIRKEDVIESEDEDEKLIIDETKEKVYRKTR